ncbi:MAG: hypothetical protein P8X63_12325 [Desulfuromonadaceae bacterium]
MIDCHCHLLPGLDDGPDTLDKAVAMARTLAGFGFVEVYCTPHCIGGLYETTPALVRERSAQLQSALDRARIPLSLRPGMEYYLDSRFPQALRDPLPLGDSRLLLVEAPPWAGADLIFANMQEVAAAGYVPLLAHPERCNLLALPDASGLLTGMRRLLRRDKAPPVSDLVRQLQSCGCLFQGNIGSFAGRYGRIIMKRAQTLLATGVYNCFGSDAHSQSGMEQMLTAGLDQIQQRAAAPQQLLDAGTLFPRSQ